MVPSSSDADSPSGFEVATFYTEGQPHDKGIAMTSQADVLQALLSPFCARFHRYSARRVRRSRLADGTPGALFAREFSRAAGHLNFPNIGLNTVGFGAFKPFVILHVLERMAIGDVLLFLDCNVHKHWNLGAYPELAARTTRWVLATVGAAHEDVVMPRENPSTRLHHICSAAALGAAESRCTASGAEARNISLGQMASPHSNRLAVSKSAAAEGVLRLWLKASLIDREFVPSPLGPGGRRGGWHCPEQCSFGLIDACRHGRAELWFEYFYTPHHARYITRGGGGGGGGGGRGRAGAAASAAAPAPPAGEGIQNHSVHVSRARTPPRTIPVSSRWGQAMLSVATIFKGSPSHLPESVVDACNVFPRHASACPGVMYRRANTTHWVFEATRRKWIGGGKGRPL